MVERYSLSLERAREKYAADIHVLWMSVFSINQGLIALASTKAGRLVPRTQPRGWNLAHGIIA